MSAAWMQTASGRAFDLVAPRPEDVDFAVDVPEALARIARFAGHCRAGAYSVAQHCVLGAEAILAETHDPALARAFLLHDAHEAYCGDIPSPVVAALEAIAYDTRGGPARVAARDTIRSLRDRIDAAIYTAAGIDWPLPHLVADRVRVWDIAMLAAERRQLLGPAPRLWAPEIEDASPAKLRRRLTVWPWTQAADAWRASFASLFPEHSF